MRSLFVLPIYALLFYVASAHAAPKRLTPETLRLIPSQYDIHSPRLKFAKRELEAAVELCGAGVIEGSASDNRCSYQVKLDDLFFTPLAEKTGLLHDPNWPYQDGVTWYEAAEQDEPMPDDFDIRDLMKNGQPDLRRQNCGDCWAWATHHGLELARAVHDQEAFDHSSQSVLSCSRKGTCGGGYMSAVDFLLHGLPYENEFPYAGTDKSCKYSPSAIATGWDGKIQAAPYIGSSLNYSKAKRRRDGSFREGSKVEAMMAAMHQWKSPLVVTVSSYNMGAGVYNSCSALNSGGNHMVTIVGWEMWQGKRVAHVWNSHGKTHGENGVSRIVWECGDGKLNRGLGVSARIVQYKAPCTPPDAAQTYLHEILAGQSTQIGATQSPDTNCSWAPTAGLTDPNSCVTTAQPGVTTEYHLTASNACGTSSSMAMVHVWGGKKKGNRFIRTPHGDVASR